MSTNDAEPLTQDTAYELLSNKRRRFVISRLRRTDGSVSIHELAEELAAWENEIPESELSNKQIKRLYVSLYQIHVPKLEEAGLVDYDKERGHVQLTSSVSALDRYLPQQETADEGWGRWETIYTALAAVALGLYAGVFLFEDAFAWLSLAQLNLVTVGAFLTVTVAQYLIKHR